ncbi:MAG: nitronate monooxygenase [Dehalococcoidia bacterium]
MSSIADVVAALPLPLICAPMTGVSGPELTAAACVAGVAGSFPTGNCRTSEELDGWLAGIQAARSAARAAGRQVGPLAVNLIIRGNRRIAEDIDLIVKHGVDFVITSVGSPAEVVGPLHAGGVSIIADVASMHHAARALEAGVDGLVLLTAGAGGHTGWANGFAFVRAVRAEYAGPVVMAGGISDGAALWAARVLGCDLGYMGTKFIATVEARGTPEYKGALVTSSLDDVTLGIAPNGIAASSLKSGSGSAGHSVSGVRAITTAAELVETTRREWFEAIRGTETLAGKLLA